MAECTIKELVKAREQVRAQIRARIEHPLHVVKNLLRFKKTSHKGLVKNTAMLFSLFELANPDDCEEAPDDGFDAGAR